MTDGGYRGRSDGPMPNVVRSPASTTKSLQGRSLTVKEPRMRMGIAGSTRHMHGTKASSGHARPVRSHAHLSSATTIGERKANGMPFERD
jgi:hypothetical protein